MAQLIVSGRGLLGLAVLAILVALVALPVLAAEPSASPAATAEPSAQPRAAEESAKPEKTRKVPKAAKVPEVPVTITGTVASRTDADGRAEYTMNAGGRTLVLDGGPSWFYGDAHPLKPYVGKRVTITGSQRAGKLEVDVEAVDGQAIRAPGKPPWAGGWKRVGERHPGWTQEKWDRWQAKAAGKARARGTDCFPPGQCKDKPAKGAASGDMTAPDAGN